MVERRDISPADSGMADEQVEETSTDTSLGRPWWRWLIILLVAIPLTIAVLLPPSIWFLSETAAGRAFVARQIGNFELQSGMRFKINRIDGSLLSEFMLVDTVVHDLDGPLVAIPETSVSWRPRTLLTGLISLEKIDVPSARLLRLPNLNPPDPDDPLLPDINLHIGDFQLHELVLEEPVLGQRETLAAKGLLTIDHGRLITDLETNTSAGDQLLAKINAVPEENKLDLSLNLDAPATGVFMRMANLDEPMRAKLDGQGSWAAWRGAFNATYGANPLGQLDIRANDGRFHLLGQLMPAPLLPEAARGGVEPAIDLDLTIGQKDQWFDIHLLASSPAFALTGKGQVDANDNLLKDVRAELVVRDAAKLYPDLSGKDIRATLAANGKFSAPDLEWKASAASLRYAGPDGPMGADDALIEGGILHDPKKQMFSAPFKIRAGKLVGLPEDLAPLLANPRVDGTLGYANGTLTLTSLKADTAGLSATGNATLLENGEAKGQLSANLKRYVVPSFGPVGGTLDTNFRQTPGKLPTADGKFSFRSLGITNESVANIFGSAPTYAGNFKLGADQVFALSSSLRSRKLNTSTAQARYHLEKQSFAAKIHGASQDYGPFALDASGTVERPRATLAMAKPDFGLGITDLLLTLTPDSDGLRLIATGASPQGPLEGDVRIGLMEGEPLTLNIRRVAYASLSARGRLVQTEAGPFEGLLAVEGQGLDARINLANAGGVQQAKIDAQARNANIPLETPILIREGIANLTVLLMPDAPHVNGGFRMKGLRTGTLLLTDVSGRADLKGLAGAATIEAAGRSGGGKDFAAKSHLTSVQDGYRVTLDGTLGKLPLKLAQPAQIIRVNKGWQLRPTRLVLPKGTVDIAGRFADHNELRLTLNDVDLAVADMIDAELGISGLASGAVDLRMVPGAILPKGGVNLTIKGLSRAGVTGVSVPVDLVLAGTSADGGVNLGGRITMDDRTLGRLVLKVDPARGATMADRFLHGKLSGGIRYNGSVEPLWALGGPEGQELRGALAVGVDFAGTPDDPELRGVAHGQGISYHNAALGTEILDIAFDGRFSGPRFELTSLTGKANGGTITGKGHVIVGTLEDRRILLQLDLKNARLANSDLIEMTMSGPLTLEGQGSEATLSGELSVDKAYIQLVQFNMAEVASIKVRREGEVTMATDEISASAIKLNIRVNAADEAVRVEGMGLDTFWGASLRVRGSAADPQLLGRANLSKGEFSFAGSEFDITTGRIVFNGTPLASAIDIQAQTQAEDVLAVVRIGGTAERPQISFSSTPSLPEDEILARLLFGASVADLSVTEAVQLATAVAGLQSGVDSIGKIRRSIGLDRLRLVGGNDDGMGTGIAIGKRLSKNIYLEVITDSEGNTLSQIQLTLSRLLSLFTEVSSLGRSSVNLRYQREH